jgi:Putative MetA-pathway of phenol degradation
VRSPLILAAALSMAAGARGFAQTRPLATEEASTAAAGTVLLEAGASAISEEPNFLTGATRDRWDAAELRLVYSPAGNVELDVEWTVRVGARDDPDFGDVSDFGDVALRAKVRMAGHAGGRDAVGLRFGVVLPQTSFGNGLGPNALRMSAQVLASKSVGGATVHLNAGLAIHDEPLRAHEQRDFFAYGAAVTWPVGRVTLVGEAAGLAGSGSPGADARSEARAGMRLGAGRLRGDVAVRRGLTDSVGEWGITAGVSWTLGGP